MSKKQVILEELAVARATGTKQISKSELVHLCRKVGCIYPFDIRAHTAWLEAAGWLTQSKENPEIWTLTKPKKEGGV